MNIFEYFKKKGIDTIDSSFYTKIAAWDSWYRSNVRNFHQYRVYHGASNYRAPAQEEPQHGRRSSARTSADLL